MGNYYLDIETTGLDEVEDKIITIQYVELERGTGKQIGELKNFKEWDDGEEEMIRQFIIDSPVVNSYGFDFVSVGYNLGFEHRFLHEKTNKYKKLFPINIFTRPFIDLRSVGVLMNNGEFKGSGLDKLTGKPHGGSPIPEWYKLGEYKKIEEYIKKETQEFVKFFRWTHTELPLLRPKLDRIINSN